jgi:hypothetical protein
LGAKRKGVMTLKEGRHDIPIKKKGDEKKGGEGSEHIPTNVPITFVINKHLYTVRE